MEVSQLDKQRLDYLNSTIEALKIQINENENRYGKTKQSREKDKEEICCPG